MTVVLDYLRGLPVELLALTNLSTEPQGITRGEQIGEVSWMKDQYFTWRWGWKAPTHAYPKHMLIKTMVGAFTIRLDDTTDC